MAQVTDKELEQYRNLLETPTEFRDGFSWSTVIGVFFCGLVMMPGSIYLSLMTGGGGMGQAATWVTVILFAEVSRRAMKTMSKQELVILLHAAQIMIAANALFPGGPFGHMVFRAYLLISEPVRDAGMTNYFPDWFVPSPDSNAILERNFFHADWAVPIALAAFMMIIGFVKRYTLGYFFFRLTSDAENLPFPFAPISAQGVMAMAEMDEKQGAEEEVEGADGKKHKGFSKWRLFSLGVVIGISFGVFQVGIPAITGLFFDQPFYLIPQPFVDTTTFTERLLPATPTGIALDAGLIGVGLVVPFWAVMGTCLAVVLTLILNPILHHFGVLSHWQPGMDTVNTLFSNSIDFYMSFGIGAAFGIAIVSIYSTVRDVMRATRDRKAHRESGRLSLWETPQLGRGDYPLWIALVLYSIAAIALVIVCHRLVPQVPVSFLVIFSFLYNPLISYVNARLIGIAGQHVDIPLVKEVAFVASGAKGIDIWMAPIPIENFGGMAQSFRVNELTGVSFWSLVKADLVALPVLFILSWVFWAFIWYADPIPSQAFPYAQVHWELAAKNQVLLWSSTFVADGEDPDKKSITDSEFWKAIHPQWIGSGIAFTVLGFAFLTFFGLPTMLVYGFIRGLGQFPHIYMLEIVGALLSRYWLQKKFGPGNFLRMAPTILAGYFTGVGLISMATIALNLIREAVSTAPF